jgi:stage II sporulation protein D
MLSAIDHLGRLMRPHALLLTGACLAMLFVSLPLHRTKLNGFNWTGAAARDEIAADSALQSAAENALAGRPGTIVIMDAQTGRIRASVNLEDAYRQALMPGSTIKPFTTLAALRAGLIDEDSRTTCPGRFTGLSFSLPCVHADHLPPFTPSQAIAYSCNFYFASLGQRLGRDKLIETLQPFGFGQPTGISGLEANGLVRPCNTGNRALVRTEANHVSEQADCAAREAIGESNQIQVTPIQLLTAYAALLNGGHLFQPQPGAAGTFQPIERAQVSISDRERRVLSEGMSGALRYGTARKARLDSLPLSIFGKTGTAAPPKGFRANGWFIGLAGPPKSVGEVGPVDIQLAVLIFLPRAHGAEAAAVSREIFNAYAGAIREQPDSAQSKVDSENKASLNSNAETPIKVHSVSEKVTRELSLEDYVLGVMHAEGSMESEPEALKALAVAIRTYAVKNRGRHAKDGYDFCSTTHCQRFAPSGSEGASPPARERVLIGAVRDTEGQILLDDRSQPVEAYFGASCGGETANIGTLWGPKPPVYLRGVHDEFCVTGPHANWTDVITRSDLLHALRSDSRTDVGARLDRLSITKTDETGRAEFITLEGEQRKLVRGWDFKIIVGRALGWNLLKSSRFEVSRAGNNFVFHGSGFGHGLGLCQEGAHTMAARGASYQRILEKYFPGTSVGRTYSATNAALPPHSAVSLRLTAKGKEIDRGSASTAGGEASVQINYVAGEASLTAVCGGKAAATDGSNTPHWAADVLPGATLKLSTSPSVTRFLTISSEHFRVTYPADVARRDADQVLSALESARADFLRRANAASVSINGLPALEIRLNDSTGDFVGRTGQPWWAAAATKGNRIELQPFAILKRRGVLATTLRHELAHVIIDVVSRDRAPRWLEEGFAIYLAGEGSMFSNHARRSAMATDELERRLEHPKSKQEMRALYGQAYLNVSELVRKEGEAGVWRRLRSG